MSYVPVFFGTGDFLAFRSQSGHTFRFLGSEKLAAKTGLGNVAGQRCEMAMDFVAIDVETANADMASICQIGVAGFANGQVAEEWKSYVDPEDYFDGMNISIHGISEAIVAGSPVFSALDGKVRKTLEGNIVVTHTAFDRLALSQAGSKEPLNKLVFEFSMGLSVDFEDMSVQPSD